MTDRFNPFRPSSIVTHGMFRGRSEELTVIERTLFQTQNENPQNFLIEGERGIGKSSLMLFVEDLARGKFPAKNNKNFNFLVVSIELEGQMSQIDIMRRLATTLKIEIAEKEKLKSAAQSTWDFLSNWEILGVKYNKKNEQLLDANEILMQLASLLEDVAKKEEIDGILLLLDEADKPSVDANLGTLVKLLSERLTKRGCHKVCLGLAGLPDLISKLKSGHESAPRMFNVLTLEPLSPSERRDIIEAGLQEANQKNDKRTGIESKALDLISDLSEGYPHFVQQFAFSAFEEDCDYAITADDVQKGTYKENGALDQLGHKYFSTAYFDQINSDDYRKVLQVMAAHLDSWITRKQIIESSQLKDSTVSNALNALKDRGIIIPSEAKDGRYRLPTKSFATWIKAITVKTSKLRV